MAASAKVGFAVVGLGSIAQGSVLPAFRKSRKAKLVAVVSLDKKKAVELGRRFEAKAAYSAEEYDQCLASPAISAIYIATPQGEHLDLTVRAAKAGKHVLCEKPLAISASDAKTSYELAKSTGLINGICHNYRKAPAIAYAAQLVKEGRLGKIRHFRGTYLQDWIVDPSVPLTTTPQQYSSLNGASVA